MSDFPVQGGDHNVWGTKLRNFFSPYFDLVTGLFIPNSISHANLAAIGTNTHAQIDIFIVAAVSTYAPIANGVTNGNTHDHTGGDGAQIDHVGLANIGTNTHSQVDTFIASKAQASGLASLGAGSLAVQNPTNATGTATASKIPIADDSAKLDTWISDATTAVKGKASFDTNDFAVASGVVTTKESGLDPALIPLVWTTPAYSAGNFSAGGSMTWTVDSSDIGAYKYAILGKLMVVIFKFYSTSVAGTPSLDLILKIPAAKTASGTNNSVIFISDNGSFGTGMVEINPGETIIHFYKTAITNWTASTNNTSVLGQIVFDIQ